MPAMDYARVAELYDIYINTDFDRSFFIEECRDAQSVLELTSGTGRLSIPLLEAGLPLTCVDGSVEMLAVLRRKLKSHGLTADVYTQNIVHLSIPQRFERILLPFNAFSEILQPAEQHKALVAIRAHLADDGRFICTLHNPPVRRAAIDGRRRLIGVFPLPNGAGALKLSTRTVYDPVADLARGEQIYEIYSHDGALRSVEFLPLRFRLPGLSEMEALASGAGLRIERLYGDYDRSPYAGHSPYLLIVYKT